MSITVPYTGGNGLAYPAGTAIPSTGVIGLFATLQAGTASATGNAVYVISGTPSGPGTANFDLTFPGSANCAASMPVNATAASATLNCGGRTVTGTLTAGTATSGVNITVPYTSGNGAAYPQWTPIPSTGVTGLFATLQAGTATSTGNAVYVISGTPSGSGTANFDLTFPGSANCAASIPVNFSITAIDCADYNNAVITGTNTTRTGSFSYTGGTNGQPYPAQSFSSTGVTGLTLSYPAGTIGSNSRVINFTITGTPSGTGTASFNIVLGNRSCTLLIPVGASKTITLSSCGLTGSTTDTNGNILRTCGASGFRALSSKVHTFIQVYS